MGRRQARETALQVLFQIDLGKTEPDLALNNTAEEFGAGPQEIEFARQLVMGTLEHIEEIDAMIGKVSKEWQLNRMANVDRNIMRLAIFEMNYRADIPKSVSVNEALELSKIFGTPDSVRFINGILGKLLDNKDEAAPVISSLE
ncbi:NusB antitermination factor [Desulforamulus reducens MI-1]|uniref:Transcription antitermination protein NusB n=1 Tax=Desulforamulus reducens (strain ATCC BAA-1160 / DSM 100696 / MI-1) TaxID=349161 RepID=NUSB_DESRM|nr:transcription antitermination factor NusB [Desulforamulus reducens]A4J3F1.1 RecName: Full=Transcription antitermination protein NusB; AltName: Full=Antitermination factor NusB [Desulforamulus reducens MI-1]ABO49604.1 NusB antitermination factor [Desulforamulus reducens MI-1]